MVFYSTLYPFFLVLLGKGNHEITSSWTPPDGYGYERTTTLGITRSNITFVGTDKDTTTVLGGFGIRDLENITFKNMTVTNTSGNGHGIHMSNAEVELFDVALKGCNSCALLMLIPTSENTVVLSLPIPRNVMLLRVMPSVVSASSPS